MAHATVTERCNQASADVPRQPSGRIRRRPPGGRCGAAAADHPGYTISAFGSSSTSTSISAPWPAGRTPATSSSRSSCQPSPVATRSMTRTVRGRGSLRTRSANDWPEEWRQWRNEPHSLALEGRETLRELNARRRIAKRVRPVAQPPQARSWFTPSMPRSPEPVGQDPRSTGSSRSPTALSRRYASSTACGG